MRVMILGKATKDTEAGVPPSTEAIAAMGKYNEELVKSGIVLEFGGLKPTSKAKRVRFEGNKRTVIDGPFAETKELIAGFQIWQVRSIEEAIEWVKRAPLDIGAEVDIRPLFEPEDFGENLTPELKEKGRQLREQMEKKHSA